MRFRQGGIGCALARGSLLPHRADLCIGRSGRGIRLHRDHGTARLCAAGHEDDRARSQSFGCGNRDSHVPEVWKAVMAKVWPFAILGFPFSLLGGAVQLPADIYYPVVGVVLVLSAAQMARTALRRSGVSADLPTDPPFIPALATGAIIGFISGTTGTGGGVFLAPVILAMNWGTARQTAATTAVYNLMNSAAALLGAYAWWDQIPSALPGWLIAVAVGGSLGAFIGSRYLPELWLRIILAVILFASGVRLLFG